ncbi:DUF397 domain-containing protein [Streptomyces bohaiensis]|uniref:DUF397 domain-containing protein n=1 Tax=Streptomyces bohaiensis TaxID=1431344 RepID=A0ABX1C9H8_9ACTN|nr:DUF397 domain-containing protein [Streptomyces bohaiensis]NJQ14718.1 DUF397 domain-containing protein [Streptomyces bohaiensis]
MSESCQPNWRTSSYTGSGDNSCVEVADNQPAVLVRDTKHAGAGPMISFSPEVWSRFTATVPGRRFHS